MAKQIEGVSERILSCARAEFLDKWYGVTYREDKPVVVEAIAKKTADGLYPENLWA